MFFVQVGPPLLLEGLLVNLVDASVDVDEDGPYMQRATAVGDIPTLHNTVCIAKLSLWYSASMIKYRL